MENSQVGEGFIKFWYLNKPILRLKLCWNTFIMNKDLLYRVRVQKFEVFNNHICILKQPLLPWLIYHSKYSYFIASQYLYDTLLLLSKIIFVDLEVVSETFESALRIMKILTVPWVFTDFVNMLLFINVFLQICARFN